MQPTTEHDSDYFPSFDKALQSPGEEMLLALDQMTPPAYHMQKRDHADAGMIAQTAGVAVVGQPDTRMAMAMRSLAKMAEAGFVERVKTTDEIEGATIRYRLTSLGEREIWGAKMRVQARALHEAERRAERAEQSLAAEREARVADIERLRRGHANELEAAVDSAVREALEQARQRSWRKRLIGGRG